LALASAGAGAVPACTKASGGSGPPKGAPQQQAALVTLAPAVAKRFAVRIDTFGAVEAEATVSVKAEISGTLTKVHFRRGQDLRRGDVLFTIDSRPFQAALEGAQASLEQARAGLDQLRANVQRDRVQEANARREADRQAKLLERKISAQADYDNALTAADALSAAVRAGEAAIRAGEATIRADQALVDSARLNLGYCTIACPLDGRAGNVLVDEGNLVKANDTALVTIKQIKPVEVFFSVRQQDLPRLRQRMAAGALPVTVCPPEDPSPQTGRLTFIDNQIAPDTGMIRLGAVFDNAAGRLWPGQYVNVSLELAVLDGATVVPAKALQTGRDGRFVFVARADGTVEFRALTVGPTAVDEAVIEGGLKPGEVVVTDGQFRLKDGARYIVRPTGAGAGAAATAPAGTVRGAGR